MKNKLRNGIIICLFVFGGVYYYNQSTNSDEEIVTNQDVTYQTVVFKDDSNTLIPIEVSMNSDLETDAIIQSKIDVMKSTDYEYLGLHPILDSNLQVNALNIGDNVLTIDFSDNLYVNNDQEALDILELFSYSFTNDEINKVNLKIDGNDIEEIPNSSVPTSAITSNLGINNFESTTNYLYKTTPVVVYNTKTIKNEEYYVPVTTRIEVGQDDINTLVERTLNQLEYEDELVLTQPSSFQDNQLSIHLSSNILNDNEAIDNTLYQRIVKSLSKIEDVNEVLVYVDDQLIESVDDVNGIIDNRLKL